MSAGPPELTIETTFAGDTATVTLTGEIDLLTSTPLNRELAALLEREPPPARLCIELEGVSFMDTSGVAVLLTARRRALERGCRFGVSSASPTISRLFEITG